MSEQTKNPLPSTISQTDGDPISEPTKGSPAKTINPRNYALAFLIFFVGIIIAGIVLLYQPFSNYLILKNANPAMIALAQQAGMSNQGELVFLRATPQFATDSQMRSDCADNAAANNKNGFIEQGCYVPNSHTHSAGRIYIRQMPAGLYDQEIVTAAYEMLHSVYFATSNSKLVMTIEDNYNQVHDSNLDAQVVNFAKTEPDYRDLELFSLLGTEYSNLSPGLESYYSPYFTNRNLTVNSYNRITAIFQNEQTQLKQIQQTISTDDSLANKAYADSLAWANVGNSYEDSYDYNIYKNYISQENTAIAQYNQLSQAYNTLVTEYNGTQPVSQIQNVTTQSSK
ncbi:MAG: hypothetical protein ACYCPS_00045 [Candidatus Saccharimonadales bacterium]